MPGEIIKDLEKVEEIPADQILVHFKQGGGKERDDLVKVLKRKGFQAWRGDASRDEKVTFVRSWYIAGEPHVG